VLVCASCGAENREGARFCDSCGVVLAAPDQAREVRKVVTVLFCDVTGSTALGERIDPESLRRVMSRYFETAKAIVERHGGTVEKFIGDAVMAVFGVPTVHEDDALRAVRAADELRAGLGELNDELEAGYGTRLELRMGVNTGEVVTGTEERLATGDAVNVAARLEQAAQPGDVLLGEETYRLVRAGVDAEAGPPVEAKGKSEPLAAYRLVAVADEAPARRHGARMIGRERQRELLEGAFANVASDRSCHLFTILGTAGVGKSRLAQEFLSAVDATVVRGRCLSYGEGISYWPVTEVVKQLDPDTEAGGPLGSILGGENAWGSPEEIAWAFRKLLESRAAERPVVVVFDDLHWGEPTFLDLVEHVADLSRGAPILLLCMARPELLDVRPAWGGGKLNATTVLLEPLTPDETAELLGALGDGMDDRLRGRILEAAGGNPLFVEEMVAVANEGEGEVAVPPTIHALLAARLDQLDPAERGVLERGAVEGQVFHRGAVAALAPEETQVDGRLVTLVRKDLVRPTPTVVRDDDAYRFRHLLIRDTAYEALPKAKRSELHERFGGWLAEHGAGLVELDEILGYHLEQAYRYRAELGPLDSAARALAERAAGHLLASAERAAERGDRSATTGLLTRALELFPTEHPDRPKALLELAVSLLDVGEFDRAMAALDDAEAAAGANPSVSARCRLIRIELQIRRDRTATMAGALAGARDALAELEQLGDEEGAVRALRLVGNLTEWSGSSRQAEVYWRQALERAAVIDSRQSEEVLGWLVLMAWWGPTPLEEGVRLCDEVIANASSKRLEAYALIARGALRAVAGQLEEGRRDLAAGRGLVLDLGHLIDWAGLSALEADAELFAGDPARAYEAAMGGRNALEQSAETGYKATVVGYIAQAALALGRDAEAMNFADEVRALAAQDDFEPLAREQFVRAQVLARRGDIAGADELIASAGVLVEPTDWLPLKHSFACAQAEVARLAERPDEQRAALERALHLAEAKGNLVDAGRHREALAALGSGHGPALEGSG
jgi:class 3 adenylate cyclase/tetratricopeptide (TPR) repeat protein